MPFFVKATFDYIPNPFYLIYGKLWFLRNEKKRAGFEKSSLTRKKHLLCGNFCVR